jgi:hypothetical protein
LKRRASGKRSGLEERAQQLFDDYGHQVEYEVDKLYFTQPEVKRYYLPDFKLDNGTYIEIKGRLTAEDRRKMLWVKEQNPEAIICFIFGNGKNKLTKRSKSTYLDWAEKHGFPAIDISQPIPKSWFKKKNNK